MLRPNNLAALKASQGQAGIEFFLLDGVDRLPRRLQPVGQLRLGPVAFGAQNLQTVFHWYLLLPANTATA